MIILPAIDLLGGKCVRLRQGKYDDVTIYNDDPLAQAWEFKEAGAEWIHIVDLDAAKSGIPTNHEIIKEISVKTGLKVDTGGGIRNMDTLTSLIEEYGVSRCVLGTSAIKDRPFTEKALARYGDKIAIGIDAKGGEVAVDGWTEGSGVRAVDFALTMKSLGAVTVIFTDIARDGMLTGPAFDATREVEVAAKCVNMDEAERLMRDRKINGIVAAFLFTYQKIRVSVCQVVGAFLISPF